MDPALLEFVETIEAEVGTQVEAGPVQLLVAVDAGTAEDTVAEMQAQGFLVGSVAGDVVSGQAAATAVAVLAELPGVIRMELAMPLAPEAAPPVDFTE